MGGVEDHSEVHPQNRRDFKTRLSRFLESCLDEFIQIETGESPGFHIHEASHSVEIQARTVDPPIGVMLRFWVTD